METRFWKNVELLGLDGREDASDESLDDEWCLNYMVWTCTGLYNNRALR